MTLQTVQILRLAFGVWLSIAVSYGVSWQLSFITPIFAAIFLSMPGWIGWRMAIQIVIRMIFSLLLGLLISEVFLLLPMVCIPLYGLLFFYIYYNDTPTAPPFSTLFMTLGITIVPLMGLSGAIMSHSIALALLVNLCFGLFFAWLFHALLPDNLAKVSPQEVSQGKKDPAPKLTRKERIAQAMMSTVVALFTVVVFFSFNLSSYAYAMIQVCFMVGSASANATFTTMKINAIACFIGGVAIVIVYNLLTAVPSYQFLLAISLLTLLVFSRGIYSGRPKAKIFIPGLITFLVLLGTSTIVGKDADSNFYTRIALVLFAGLFSVTGLVLIDHLFNSRRKLVNDPEPL
jgi:hypothetical protein